MKIHVTSEDHNIHLWIPTNLFFNPMVAHFAVRYGLRHAPDSARNISPDAMDSLFAEFRRIKKQYGRWELVDMETSTGDKVKIVL